MLSFLLLHDRLRYYRVAVGETLFGEYAVMREWGPCGSEGRARMAVYGNLRDAVLAADHWLGQAQRRGYVAQSPHIHAIFPPSAASAPSR